MPTDRWRASAAPVVHFTDRVVISLILGAGVASVLRLFDWWFRGQHVANNVLFIILSAAFWYGISRIVLGWINYAGMARPEHRTPPDDLRVAIFTTSAPGEPHAMLETTLAACRRIRYPHRTYLLDDTGDPHFREIAAQHDAVWLELTGLPGAKAGKVNRALSMTTEDFILVLDPDHIPFPGFLDRVLGQFDDAEVGFVQVAQAYYNQHRSFTAAGAAEQTYTFYGPGLMGLYGHGGSLAIGANCTFRRAALASIGGHGIGLAEDLVTAIRLHAAGWRSVYVPEIVSRGLVPEDLASFYKQQLKWARGVYEVAFAELPRLAARLTWRQRVSYLAIGTYYLCGITTGTFLLFPYLYLWIGAQPAAMPFNEFLSAIVPVGACGLAMYLYVQEWLCDPAERGVHWRGALLKLACWPVYAAGTLLAVLRIDIPYTPTAKQSTRGRFWQLAWPHLFLIVTFLATTVWTMYVRLAVESEAAAVLNAEAVWGMVAFATLPVVAAFAGVFAAWEAGRLPARAPWDDVPVNAPGAES